MAGGLTAAGLAAPAVARARWAGAPDPTEGRPLELPPGEEVRVRTSDGGELAAWVAGQGPAVVLVHGWTESRECWGPVARRLVERGRRAVAFDLRGHGSSSPGSSGLTLEALAGDVASVLEALHLEDVVLAGHSMGGMAVQLFAAAYSDGPATRVARLVLVATSAKGIVSPQVAVPLARAVVGARLVERAVGSGLVGPFLVRGAAGSRPSLSHLSATARLFASTPAPTRVAFFDAMAQMDLTPELPKIRLPTVVVAGELDRILPRHHSETIARLIPGAELKVLPGTGHQLLFEAPEALADLLVGD